MIVAAPSPGPGFAPSLPGLPLTERAALTSSGCEWPGVTGERWLHADHLGSIVAMTNTSGGSPSINSYDEYGIPASTNSGRFQYTGQAWLPETGLYHYKARFYSPTLGRFLQTDPIGYEDQINLYAYVGNDPVNGFDPTLVPR